MVGRIEKVSLRGAPWNKGSSPFEQI